MKTVSVSNFLLQFIAQYLSIHKYHCDQFVIVTIQVKQRKWKIERRQQDRQTDRQRQKHIQRQKRDTCLVEKFLKIKTERKSEKESEKEKYTDRDTDIERKREKERQRERVREQKYSKDSAREKQENILKRSTDQQKVHVRK